MKTIGLIGGISWESTSLYYQIMNRRVQEILGGVHSCDSLIYSVDFAEIAELQKKGDWDQLTRMTTLAAKRLEAGGADFFLICANTMHKVADEVTKDVDIPLLHIADAAAERIQSLSMKKLGLVATRYSMEEPFLRDKYRNTFGIETIIPGEKERNEIHKVIYEELVKGIFSPESKKLFLEIMNGLVDQGAEGIISGCTEIELLIKPEDLKVPLIQTTRLHAEKAVAMALGV